MVPLPNSYPGGIQLLISAGGQQVDYTRYLDQATLKIQEQINIPTQCTFSLTPSDAVFQVPVQRAYVTVWSQRWQRSLFTGFVSSEPTKNFLGLSQFSPTPNTLGPSFTVNASQLTAWLVRVAGRSLGTPDEWCFGMNVLIPGSCPGLSNEVLIQLGMLPDESNRDDLPQTDATTFLNTLDAFAPPIGPTNIGPSQQDESAFGKRQMFRYDITVTSDEYLLNIKAVPFIPAYINRTQGEILSDLASVLCTGFFDTTSLADGGTVASGDLVPYFQYDPHTSWSEVAKQFCDASRYRYKMRDRTLFFTPYGDQPLGIDYDEIRDNLRTFDPRALQTTVLTVPLVNDITIIGDAEGGNNHEDYFIGDGFTGNFPLQHKVFRGASVLLAQDTWATEQGIADLNTQSWFLQDPGTNFSLAGALNLITPASGVFNIGESFLQLNNGVEVAGGLHLQHGEFTFEDTCAGIVGGLYTNENFEEASFVGGFVLTTDGPVVQPPPIFIGVSGVGGGVGGVTITPTFNTSGTFNSPPVFWQGTPVVTKPNHNYVLLTDISAPQYVRYNQTYRTLAGEVFGGLSPVALSGSVTFTIAEYDIVAATGFYYQPTLYQSTIQNVDLLPFALYALINNQRLNLTVINTTIEAMPLGALTAQVGLSGLAQPSGLVLPMLPPNSGDYIGGVLPWPGMPASGLGPLGSVILPPPLLTPTGHTVLVIGTQNDFLSSAQITPGNNADTLAFYGQTLPAAGTPIRLQSWESQAAVSRLQDAASIQAEAFIVGDDGIRSAIVSDLNPLPRTSEDCDNAGMAFLADRIGVSYNGTYTITSLSFQGTTSDQQFWPTVGRFLHVNSPRREIQDELFLITGLTITMLDMKSELMNFQIGFGADLYLEKVLKNFVDLRPPSILTPNDKANPPNPRFTQQVDNSLLPDLNNVQVTNISDVDITVQVFDDYFGLIEVRKQDTGWGSQGIVGPDQNRQDFNYITTVRGPVFNLTRNQLDQTWYLRPIGSNPFDQPILSRRSKVLRVFYPTKPSPPIYRYSNVVTVPTPGNPSVTTQTLAIQFDVQPDVRNIAGIELRAADDKIILYQRRYASLSDLYIDLSQTPFLTLTGFNYRNYSLKARFFNEQWSMSDPLDLDLILEAPHIPYVWSPDFEIPITGDMMYHEYGFGLRQDYVRLSDGTSAAVLDIYGVPPPNQPSSLIDPPLILNAFGTSGGSIPSGTYEVGICAFDTFAVSGAIASGLGISGFGASGVNYNCTELSNLMSVDVPDGGSIVIDVAWGEGSFGGGVFVATPDSSQGWHNEFLTWSPTTVGLPTTITINDVAGVSFGAPDRFSDHFDFKFKQEVHSGIWAEQVQAVGSGSLTFGFAAGSGSFDVNSLSGRIFSLLARFNITKTVPIVNLWAVSNTEDTVSFGANPDTGEVPGDLRDIIDIGDLMTARIAPSGVTPLGFSDPMFHNNYEPQGLKPHAEAGNLAWILSGPGAGSVNQIADNDDVSIILAAPWTGVTPTSGSVIVIVNPAWDPVVTVQHYASRNWPSFAGLVAQPQITNEEGSVWIVQAEPADTSDRTSEGPTSPSVSNTPSEFYNVAFREVFLWGNGIVEAGATPFALQANGYAMLTIINLGLETAENASQIKAIDFFAPSIDETDTGLWASGSIAFGDDSFSAFVNGGSRFADPDLNSYDPVASTFNVGDYVIWNDPVINITGMGASGGPTGIFYQYEIDQITSITGSIAASGTSTVTFGLSRVDTAFPSTIPNQAYFGSYRTDHTDCRIYRLIPRHFAQPVQQFQLGTGADGVPSFWEFAWANKCVTAVVAQVLTNNTTAASRVFVLNAAPSPNADNLIPPSPGLRTENGAAYMNLGVAGTIAANARADVRARVQAWESIRTVYGYVGTAPAGNNGSYSGISGSDVFGSVTTAILVYVLYIEPLQVGGTESSRRVAVIEQVAINDGELSSYGAANPPSKREMPYNQDWPPNELPVVGTNGSVSLPFTVTGETIFFSPDGEIDLIVVEVGTTGAGSDLTIVVQT